jgi:ribosomal protein S18 acetylase RimI-like enzyme
MPEATPIPALCFRTAVSADLPGIVALLAEDQLGADRERIGDVLAPGYRAGFDAIASDPNQSLMVGELDGLLVGCLQITFIPGISHVGAWRGQIEAVRVRASHRGRGLGEQMMRQAIQMCRDRRCRIVQLTTNKVRTEAQRFYGRLGFKASHEGMKLDL